MAARASPLRSREQAVHDELVRGPDGLPDLVASYLRAFGPGTAADVG